MRQVRGRSVRGEKFAAGPPASSVSWLEPGRGKQNLMKLTLLALPVTALIGVLSASGVWADRHCEGRTVVEAQVLPQSVSTEKANFALTSLKTGWPVAGTTSGSSPSSLIGYFRLQQADTKEESDASFHGRLGLLLSPNVRFAGGLDYTL